MSEIDLEAINAELYDAHLATVAFIASDGHTSLGVRSNQEAADAAEATVRPHFDALLTRIAELEAERDERKAEARLARALLAAAKNDPDYDPNPIIGEYDRAERRGYERAVARLRDEQAWAAYMLSRDDEDLYEAENTFAADYLEAVKESNE